LEVRGRETDGGGGRVYGAEKYPQREAGGAGGGQYSEGSRIVVADRSASVITHRRSPVEVL
jgi:hypothetical protein